MNSDPVGEYLRRFYPENEFPALERQYRRWRETRPLAGVRVLDATPLFRNTLAKHRALLAAGARLTVGTADEIPFSPEAATKLAEWGIARIHNGVSPEKFDVILDCGGVHARLLPRFGFAELTRSGVPRFTGTALPVVSIDDSRLKLSETALGTGDGFVRAMKQLGYGDFGGRRVVVFGGGKVGSGIALALRSAGAEPVIVDELSRWREFAGVRWLDRADRAAVRREVAGAWCAVTATGVAGALAEYRLETVIDSPVLLANMGVEDEFGPAISGSRVLNDKKPLNFLLDEPTRMAYIDPVMALCNLAAVLLVSGDVPPGISPPPPAAETEIIDSVRSGGVIAAELEEFL